MLLSEENMKKYLFPLEMRAFHISGGKSIANEVRMADWHT